MAFSMQELVILVQINWLHCAVFRKAFYGYIKNYDYVEQLNRATASSSAVSVTFFLVIYSFRHAGCNEIRLCRNCNSNITCVRVALIGSITFQLLNDILRCHILT